MKNTKYIDVSNYKNKSKNTIRKFNNLSHYDVVYENNENTILKT